MTNLLFVAGEICASQCTRITSCIAVLSKWNEFHFTYVVIWHLTDKAEKLRNEETLSENSDKPPYVPTKTARNEEQYLDWSITHRRNSSVELEDHMQGEKQGEYPNSCRIGSFFRHPCPPSAAVLIRAQNQQWNVGMRKEPTMQCKEIREMRLAVNLSAVKWSDAICACFQFPPMIVMLHLIRCALD